MNKQCMVEGDEQKGEKEGKEGRKTVNMPVAHLPQNILLFITTGVDVM